MKGFVVASIAVLCLSAHADKIDDLVRAEMSAGKIPGIAVAVIRDGKTTKMRGYGLANIEHNVPVKPETVFNLALLASSLLRHWR